MLKTTYKIEISVKMARNGSVLKSITNKNLSVSKGKQKKRVIRQGLFFILQKIHAIWSLKCAKRATQNMTPLVELAET